MSGEATVRPAATATASSKAENGDGKSGANDSNGSTAGERRLDMCSKCFKLLIIAMH